MHHGLYEEKCPSGNFVLAKNVICVRIYSCRDPAPNICCGKNTTFFFFFKSALLSFLATEIYTVYIFLHTKWLNISFRHKFRHIASESFICLCNFRTRLWSKFKIPFKDIEFAIGSFRYLDYQHLIIGH